MDWLGFISFGNSPQWCFSVMLFLNKWKYKIKDKICTYSSCILKCCCDRTLLGESLHICLSFVIPPTNCQCVAAIHGSRENISKMKWLENVKCLPYGDNTVTRVDEDPTQVKKNHWWWLSEVCHLLKLCQLVEMMCAFKKTASLFICMN